MSKVESKERTMEQLFYDACEFDGSYLAHFIYYCFVSGKVRKDDDAKKLSEVELSEAEYREFEKMYKSNYLRVTPIKLFAIQVNEKNYHFYFGANANEVIALHEKRCGERVTKITICHQQMIDTFIYCPESNTTKSFRQLLKEQYVFPCYVCEIEATR